MLRPVLIFLLLLFSAFLSSAQTYPQQYKSLVESKDTIAQEALLGKWRSEKPDDAELYVSYYNFFVQKSRKEIVIMGGNPPDGAVALEIMNEDTNIKEPAGYMYSDISYDSLLLDKGFAYIDTGISKFPNRLDMRYGKIYMLGEVKDWKTFMAEIIKTINYSHVNNNKWTWSNNEPVKGGGKKYMLSSLQDYVVQLYNTGDDEQLDQIKAIAEATLNYYPDHVESLSNLSVTYMYIHDNDKALVYLLRAEKSAPKDFVVLGNIAHCYEVKKDKLNSIKYYKLLEKYGDTDSKETAKKKLGTLSK